MSTKNQKNLQRSRSKEIRGRRWQKMRSRKINNKMGKKLVLLFLIVILALVGLAIRITFINLNDGKNYERTVLKQTQQQYESRIIPFKRGDIRDRNGTILATSDKVYNLILDCKVVNSTSVDADGVEGTFYVEPTIQVLTELLGQDENQIRGLLTDEKTKDDQYVILSNNMSISDKQRFEEFKDTESILESNISKEEKRAEIARRNNVKGIWFEESYRRVYPMDSLACDLIGFSNAENKANFGVEGYYSDILNGTNGRQFGYFNSDASAEQTIIDPVPGKNVITTIDVNIQQIIRSAMQEYCEKYKNGPQGEDAAENIGVIVMDPNTGEVLGMDSSNWYDLNHPSLYTREEFNAMSEAEYKKVEKELAAMWKNYCVSDSFEPGSTFKPVTVAAALETASANEREHYYCDGLEVINNATLHCVVYPDEHGELDMNGALRVSCNDALMQIGARLGSANMLKYQELFNFGMKTGIDLPGENSGLLHTEESMQEVELATTSFGQGFTCTMIQEAAAFSAIVNGGYYYKPHVVSAITDSTGAVTERMEAVVERQVISTRVSNQIREWLSGVMQEGGSGTVANVVGYNLGGKTGTAQKVNPETKSYDGSYVVSFIGCAPLENPEVVVYVVVDSPNVENQGSSIYAQEIARDIFIELLPYMNIFPDDPAATEAFLIQLEAQKEADRIAKEQAALGGQPVEGQPAEEQPMEGQPAEGQPAEGQPVEGQPVEEQTADPGGTEQPVLDTDIPAPPEGNPDDYAENGGDSIFSEGIPGSE